MEKKSEISALQSLKNDTYFCEYFNSHDIDQMCENIKNDFSIEMNCQFNAKVVALEKKIADMEASHKEEIEKLNTAHKAEMEEFGKTIIVKNEAFIDDIYETLEEQFGKEFIINTKFNANMELDDDELAYMIEIMNNAKK